MFFKNFPFILLTLFGCFENVQSQSSALDSEKLVYDGVMKFSDMEYKYKIYEASLNKNVCDGKRVLVIIKSAARQKELRHLNRQTWANDRSLPQDYLLRFIIGAVTNSTLENDLAKENEEFGDIARYDILDTYKNLTLKCYAFAQYHQSVCPKTKYLLEIDDDAVIDFKRLDYFIKNEFDLKVKQNEASFFCMVFVKNRVQRHPKDKWYIPWDRYNQTYYPNHCSGNSFLMTSKAVEKTLAQMKREIFIIVDDAYFTGIIRDKAGISIFDPYLFCRSDWKPPCNESSGLRVPRLVTKCQLKEENFVETYNKLIGVTCPTNSATTPTTPITNMNPKESSKENNLSVFFKRGQFNVMFILFFTYTVKFY